MIDISSIVLNSFKNKICVLCKNNIENISSSKFYSGYLCKNDNCLKELRHYHNEKGIWIIFENNFSIFKYFFDNEIFYRPNLSGPWLSIKINNFSLDLNYWKNKLELLYTLS